MERAEERQLLRAAQDAQVEVFVTGDQSLLHQQNLKDIKLAMVVLSANNWPIIREHLQSIADGVNQAMPGKVVLVNCGKVTAKRSSR